MTSFEKNEKKLKFGAKNGKTHGKNAKLMEKTQALGGSVLALLQTDVEKKMPVLRTSFLRTNASLDKVFKKTSYNDP